MHGDCVRLLLVTIIIYIKSQAVRPTLGCFKFSNCRRVDAMHGDCVRLLLPDCFRLNNCRRVDDNDGDCVRLVLLTIF